MSTNINQILNSAIDAVVDYSKLSISAGCSATAADG